MKTFIPVILGTDANAYGIARSFHMQYNTRALAVGTFPLKETKHSKILDTKIVNNLTDERIFKETLLKLGKELKQKYDSIFLLSCAEWYTDLIVNNIAELKKYYIIPFMDKKLKDKLESKESFYKLCEKYKLDYPRTYIITDKNKDNFSLPFSFPVALKPSSSTEYSKIEFNGKEKSYKIDNLNELTKIVNLIYDTSFKDNLIVQEYIEGNDDTMYVMNCYSNKDGKVKMMCLGRCLVEEHTPYGVGNYKAIISKGNKELYEKIQCFLESIGYVGYSNFDLKYDRKDGKYKLFEINIRQGRSSFFTTSAGCNLSKYLVDDYILNKDYNADYNYNNHLWLGMPKHLLDKYVYNKELLIEAKKLIKEKKYSYTLKYKKDANLYRLFWINRIYLKDYRTFKLYPPKEDV